MYFGCKLRNGEVLGVQYLLPLEENHSQLWSRKTNRSLLSVFKMNRYCTLIQSQKNFIFTFYGGGGASIRIEPLRQLLDDCTHKRNNKKKVGKSIYHWNSLFISFPKSTIQRHRKKLKKNLATKRQILLFSQALVKMYLLLHFLMNWLGYVDLW